jgi:hypothetical protein
MAFLAYVLRGSTNNEIKHYLDIFPEACIRLLKDCPPEDVATRKVGQDAEYSRIVADWAGIASGHPTHLDSRLAFFLRPIHRRFTGGKGTSRNGNHLSRGPTAFRILGRCRLDPPRPRRARFVATQQGRSGIFVQSQRPLIHGSYPYHVR